MTVEISSRAEHWPRVGTVTLRPRLRGKPSAAASHGRAGELGRGPSIVPSEAVIFAGFALFWGIPNSAVAIAGITVAGLGASPLYPSRITLLMERFPGATYEGSKRAALGGGRRTAGTAGVNGQPPGGSQH